MTVVNTFGYTFLADSTNVATNLNTVDSAQNFSGVDVGGSWFDVWKGGFGTIYGRVLGSPADSSTPFVINTTHGDSNQNDPDIAQLSGGHVVVTFHDASVGDEVRFRLFDASGTALGSDVAIDAGSGLRQSEAAVAALADGTFAVAWTANRGPGGAPDTTVQLQTFNADGSARSSVVALDGYGLSAAHADIAGLKNGSVVAVWQEGQGAIYAAAAGSPKFLVGNSGGATDDPRVAALKDGGFAVTYGGWGGSSNDIYLALYNANGSIRVAPAKVNTTPAGLVGDQHLSQIAVLQNGAVAVTWETTGTGGATNVNLYDPYSGALLYSPNLGFAISHQDISLESGGTGLTMYGVGANSAYTQHIDFTRLLSSNADSDVLIGTGLDETVLGGIGGHVLDGGKGTDTVSFDNASAGVTINLAFQGFEQQTGGAGLKTLSNFEHLTGSGFADTLTGDSNANVITGGAGDDVIDGGGGADILDGGAGVNTAAFAAAADAPFWGVTVSLALQNQAQWTGVYSVTLSNFQNLIGSFRPDTLTGDAGDNVIDPGGGGGGDVLNGGGGVNTVSFASSATRVTVNLSLQGAPQDVVQNGYLDTLSNFQNVIGSPSSDALTGDAGNNVIDGGGGGGDFLDGAGGVNTLSFASTRVDGLSISLAQQGVYQDFGHGVGATISHFQNLTGSAFADTLTGDANANVILGGGGNDVIRGGGGADTLTGGGGADTFVFVPGQVGNATVTDFSHAEGDRIDASASSLHSMAGLQAAASQVGANTVINLGGGGQLTLQNTLLSGLTAGDFLFNPDVQGTGSGTVTGNGANGTIRGLDGDHLMYGGGGNVTMYAGNGNTVMVAGSGGMTAYGGTGSDYFYGGSHGDSAYGGGGAGTDVFVMGSGNDTVYGGGQGYAYIYGGGGSDQIHDGAGVNVVIEGAGGANTIYGGGTVDYLYGGAGTDTIYGGAGEEILILGSGSSTFYGGTGVSYYYGGSGNDFYYGGSGIDVVVAGSGTDLLNGGGGTNYFFLPAASHDTIQMNANIAGVDVVNGFNPSTGVLNLLNTGWSGLSDVLAHTYDYMASGGFSVIALNGQAAIWLIGVSPSQLTAQDFHFN